MGNHFLVFVFMRHAILSGSRLLPELIRPRSSRAFTVLRLADAGRTTSSSFKRRKTGSPPSESVSSLYPCSVPNQVLLCLREFRQNCPSLLFRHHATSQQQGEVNAPSSRRSSCSCEVLWSDLFDASRRAMLLSFTCKDNKEYGSNCRNQPDHNE
jgi:hypothetical protein